MGLTDNEVIESRKKFGSNIINSSKRNSFIKRCKISKNVNSIECN